MILPLAAFLSAVQQLVAADSTLPVWLSSAAKRKRWASNEQHFKAFSNMSFNRFFLVLQFVVLLLPLGIVYLIALAIFTVIQLQDGDILPTLLGILLLAPFLVAAFRIMLSAIKGIESLKNLGSGWWLISSVAIGSSLISVLVFVLGDFSQFGEVAGTLIATLSFSSVLVVPFIHCVFLKLIDDGA